jgi:O-antigen/teichoic acid export membrane protein
MSPAGSGIQRFTGGFSRDFTYLMAGSVSQHLFLLMLQIVLARNMPLPDFGRLSFFGGIMSLFSLFGTAGIAALLPALARRKAAADLPPPHGMVVWATGVSAVVALANVLAYSAGAYGGFQVELGGLYYWISLSLVPVCLSASLQSVFIGFGKTRMIFHINLLTEGAKLALALYLISADSLTLTRFVIGNAGINAIGTLVNLALYVRLSRGFPADSGESYGWTPSHVEAFAYLVPSSAMMVTARLLIFLTGAYYSAEATARVGVALIFMSAFGVVLLPFQTAMLSHIQDLRQAGGDIKGFLRSSGLQLVVLVSISALGAGLLSGFATGPLFGSGLVSQGYLVAVLILLFALDAPRALLDVFCFTFLSKAQLAAAEGLRILGIVCLFAALRDSDLRSVLLGAAFICGAINLYKGFRTFSFQSAHLNVPPQGRA